MKNGYFHKRNNKPNIRYLIPKPFQYRMKTIPSSPTVPNTSRCPIKFRVPSASHALVGAPTLPLARAACTVAERRVLIRGRREGGISWADAAPELGTSSGPTVPQVRASAGVAAPEGRRFVRWDLLCGVRYISGIFHSVFPRFFSRKLATDGEIFSINDGSKGQRSRYKSCIHTKELLCKFEK